MICMESQLTMGIHRPKINPNESKEHVVQQATRRSFKTSQTFQTHMSVHVRVPKKNSVCSSSATIFARTIATFVHSLSIQFSDRNGSLFV